MEQIEISKRFFDQQAHLYDFTRNHLLFYRGKAISLLNLKKGDTVLEIGCGTGENFKQFNKILDNTGLIIGVDFSPKMLAKAKEKIQKYQYTNVFLIEADASCLKLDIQSDAVFFADSLFAIQNYTNALNNAISLLRVGGKLVILDYKLSNHPFYSLFNRLWIKWSNLFCGDFSRRPWDYLKVKLGSYKMIELLFGFRYILVAEKRIKNELAD